MEKEKIAKRVRVTIDGTISERDWKAIESGARECQMAPWEYFKVSFKDYIEGCARTTGSGDFNHCVANVKLCRQRARRAVSRC